MLTGIGENGGWGAINPTSKERLKFFSNQNLREFQNHYQKLVYCVNSITI